jgi:2-keto-4-pentenoate hydratase/2-oxohepta-3-ene-1,7-dioic acid hydratase in catechol pathway
MGYKLVTYDAGKGSRAGIVTGDRLIDAAEASGNAAYATTLGILADWEAADKKLAALAGDANTKSSTLDWSQLQAPVRPAAIYCAGANYTDHVTEMNAAQGKGPEPDPHTLGLKPWHFIKSAHAVAGPGAAVKIPPESKKMDWEIELGAVIGKVAKNVSEADALKYVAGYTVTNDLSARDLGWRPPVPNTSPFYSDWLAHKSFDGSAPIGPWIVPASDVGDPQNLGIRLSVNGVVKQDSNTSKMIYTLAEQIAQLSLRITLYPGDLIMTGTPAGVGAGRNEFLKPGDSLELWCEKVGTLKHTMA